MNMNYSNTPNASLLATERLHPKPPRGILSLKKYLESDIYEYYGIISPIVAIIVVVVNILLIATIIRGRFRTSTYIQMIAISIADCLTGLIPFPFNIYIFRFQDETGYLPVEWCYAFDFMVMILPVIAHLCSLHLTVGLAVERFIIVAFPMKAKRICTTRNGIILSVAIFFVSIISQMDLFLQVKYEPITLEKFNRTCEACKRIQRVRTDTEYIIYTTFAVFLPCLILVIFTLLLLYKTFQIRKWRKSQNIVNSANVTVLDKMNLAVILILIVVTITEVTVWTCLLLSRVKNVKITERHEELMEIGNLVFQVTSPINLIILCCLSKQFRVKLKQTILCCCCCFQKNNVICSKIKHKLSIRFTSSIYSVRTQTSKV